MSAHLHSTRQHRPSERRGFTLLELMIAVLIGSIVIMGVYTVYSVSVRGYRMQDQTLEALGNLRLGVQQLKSDLRSAAYNAPAQSDEEPWVTAVGMADPLTAVAITEDTRKPVANDTANQYIAPQMLRLLGDYESHTIYKTVLILGSVVTLEWPGGTAQDFARVFNSTNMLRIEMYGQARQEQVHEIVSASFNGGLNPTVTLAQPVQGILGFGSGHEATVVSYIQYRLEQDKFRGGTDSVKFDLVREKLDATGSELTPRQFVKVAEYVVDLQFYDICLNVTTPQLGTMIQRPVAIQCYPTMAALTAAGFSLNPDNSNQSHLLRSIKFKLATRTAFEDPDKPMIARTNLDDPLVAFELDPNLRGAAKVFEAAGTVFMTSIQARRQ